MTRAMSDSIRVRAYPIYYAGRCRLVRWWHTTWWVWQPKFGPWFMAGGHVMHATELCLVPHRDNSTFGLEIVDRAKCHARPTLRA